MNTLVYMEDPRKAGGERGPNVCQKVLGMFESCGMTSNRINSVHVCGTPGDCIRVAPSNHRLKT